MNKIFTVIILSILVLSCKDNANNINVAIKDVANGTKVTLKKQEGRKIINLDSTTVENGKFSFNYKLKEPQILGIFIDGVGKPNEGIFPLMGVNDKVTVTAYKDSLYASNIKGSKLNTDLTNLRDMRLDLSKEMSAFTTEFQAARKANDTAKINSINKKAVKIQDKISLNEWNYIKANPNSHVSIMVLSGLVQDFKYKDSIKSAFNGLSDTVKNSEIAKQLKEYLEKQNKVPAMPPVNKKPAKK